MRPNFSPTPTTSCTPTCSTAVRRRSRSGRCWRDAVARPGASTRATSCSSTSAAAGRRGVHRQREVRVQAARLGEAGGPREGETLAPYLTPAQRDPPRAPRAAAAAQPAVPPHRRPGRHRVLQERRHSGAEERHRDRRRQPRPARTPARPRCGSTCPRSGFDWHEPFAAHDVLSGADVPTGATATTCGSTRPSRACPRSEPCRRWAW